MRYRTTHCRPLLNLAAVFAALAACAAGAAEIRLKAQAEPAGAMVALGDLADVFAADSAEADRLRGLELFPAPPPGRERFVRARELHDLLLLRGVNLAEHRFSGASHITVRGAGEAAPSGPAPVSTAHVRQAKSRVGEAIQTYLAARVSAETPWLVEVDLPDAIVRSLADPAAELRVDGGRSPWVGSQQFELNWTTPAGSQQATVGASVSIPASIVVAARSLSRGVLVRASDLELRHAGSTQGEPGALYSLEQAVGKETARAIPAGKALTAACVQAPVYVRRGEIVTVYAHAAGIRIRTQGRARDAGSNGELVAVESLDTRETFFARVCGVREVEVFARAARAGDSAAHTTRQ